MNMTFQQQTAIVTGAASGLGRAIAIKLSEKGVSLALFDRDEEGLAATRTMLAGEAILCPVDITDEEMVKIAITKLAERWGRIDVLVNIAGITGQKNIQSHQVVIEDLLNVFRVNFMRSYHTSKYVLPLMLK